MFNILRDVGRAHFQGGVSLIFVRVVEKSGPRDDLDGRERLAVDDAAGKLPSFDVLFDHYFILIAERVIESFLVLGLGIYDVYADAGAAGARFYDNG